MPVGFIGDDDQFDIDELSHDYFSYLKIKKFADVDDCLDELRLYLQYACIDVNVGSAVELDVYYDNTREPVIWEMLERIKATVDFLQKAKSKEMASDFLTRFGLALDKLDKYKISLATTNSEVNSYILQTQDAAANLQNAKRDLDSTTADMDSDIARAKSAKANLKLRKDAYYSNAISVLSSARANLNSAFTYATDANSQYVLSNLRSNLDFLEQDVRNYGSQADNYFDDFDDEVKGYEDASRTGKQHSIRLDGGVSKLRDVESGLRSYGVKLSNLDSEVGRVQRDLKSIRGLDAETLVNPIIIRNTPSYIPKVTQEEIDKLLGNEEDSVKKLVKGMSLINLQTLFPTLLILITLFLSLLISSFVTLTEINSPSNTRIKMIKGTFFAEIIGAFSSSIFLVTIPIVIVILVGWFLFRLPITHWYDTTLIVYMLASIFALLGMALAYLIRKESITLLVTTFAMMFFIFFSGFLLPLEKMGNSVAAVAGLLPGKLALDAFNKSVFYGQSFSSLSSQLLGMIFWLVSLILIVVLVKKTRR